MSATAATVLQRHVDRTRQRVRVFLLSATGEWPRLSVAIGRRWNGAAAARFADAYRLKGAIFIAATAIGAFGRAFETGLVGKNDLLDFGANARARRFHVFHQAVPETGPWPWKEDWRHHHAWPLADFRSFRDDQKKTALYDVKFPRELSRLWFLQAAMQSALFEKSQGIEGGLAPVFAALEDFERENPLARSVNWEPTEAAMRLFSLLLLFDMAMQGEAAPDHLAMLLRMIAAHGAFLWRTMSWDAAGGGGSAFATQLSALFLAGSLLAGHEPGAELWQRRTRDLVGAEILTQFLQDGVHVEKSLFGHRLVTEMFLFCLLVMQRQDMTLPDEALVRLRRACHYLAETRRPDGCWPVLGDTDDARIFGFDPADVRLQDGVLALGAVLFNDAALRPAGGSHPLPPSLLWLLGQSGLDAFLALPAAGGKAVSRHYAAGGVMVVRQDGNYLLFDAGEAGRHGHNDLLSFELCLDGHPLLVDPGCPTYTGDLKLRRLFRSAAYHNGLVVDKKDIAPITGPFSISGVAKPRDVSFRQEGGLVRMAAGHAGYGRLASPVSVQREISFDPSAAVFECYDTLTVKGPHRVDRYFHFVPEATLQLEENRCLVSLHQYRYELSFDDFSAPYILTGRVSNGYGHMATAPLLMLSTEVNATVTLSAVLKKK